MISVISGANRPDAITPGLARQYYHLLETISPQTPLGFINLQELPRDFLFSSYNNPSPIGRWQSWLDQSTRVVWMFPEYNGSFPGVLKHFLDGLRYPDTLPGKKACVVALGAGSQGGALAMSHFSDILNYMGMVVAPLRVRIPQVYQKLDGQQKLADPETLSLWRQQIDQLLSL